MPTEQARTRRFRRAFLWAAGGACLSPIAGVPIWSLTDGTRFSDFNPLMVAGGGAIAGLVAARTISSRAGAGGRFVALMYPAVVAWAILVVERGYLVATSVVGLWLVVVGSAARITSRRRPALAAELWKITAATAWVFTVIGIPVFLIGLIGLPLAIASTAAARAAGTG